MAKKIVFNTTGGEVGILTPSVDYLYKIMMQNGLADTLSSQEKLKQARELVALKDTPADSVVQILDSKDIPYSRNWRDAWVLDPNSNKVSIDFERAKAMHKQLIITIALDRVKPDEFDQQDFTQVKAELNAIDWTSITTFDELLNTFPASINLRPSDRKFNMYGQDEVIEG